MKMVSTNFPYLRRFVLCPLTEGSFPWIVLSLLAHYARRISLPLPFTPTRPGNFPMLHTCATEAVPNGTGSNSLKSSDLSDYQ